MTRIGAHQAMNRLLSVSEAAELLGVSVHTVYAWVGAGRIPLVKLGRRTLFDPDALQHWVHECSRSGRPAESRVAPTPGSHPKPTVRGPRDGFAKVPRGLERGGQA